MAISDTPRRVWTRSLLWLMSLIICVDSGLAERSQEPSELDAMTLLNSACSQCHTLDPIRKKRDGIEGWRQTVREMVLRGAQLDMREGEAVAKYLTQIYGPGGDVMRTGILPPGSHEHEAEAVVSSAEIELPEGDGRQLVLGRCQMCHDLGRIISVRRSYSEWSRYAENMILRSGLPTSKDDIEPLVAYLSMHFGKE